MISHPKVPSHYKSEVRSFTKVHCLNINGLFSIPHTFNILSTTTTEALDLFMLLRLTQLKSQLIPTMAVVSTRKHPDINLYTTQTPNGIKISITLEELRFAFPFTPYLPPPPFSSISTNNPHLASPTKPTPSISKKTPKKNPGS